MNNGVHAKMISRTEFQSARDDFDKHSAKGLLFGSIGILGLVLVGLTIREFGKPWLGANIVEFAPAFSFAVGIPWVYWGLIKLAKHHTRYPELQCPHCKKPLASGARIVIASRNCFHCGEQVIDSAD